MGDLKFQDLISKDISTIYDLKLPNQKILGQIYYTNSHFNNGDYYDFNFVISKSRPFNLYIKGDDLRTSYTGDATYQNVEIIGDKVVPESVYGLLKIDADQNYNFGVRIPNETVKNAIKPIFVEIPVYTDYDGGKKIYEELGIELPNSAESYVYYLDTAIIKIDRAD